MRRLLSSTLVAAALTAAGTAAQQDLFVQHQQLMLSAIQAGDYNRVERLLQLPYVDVRDIVTRNGVTGTYVTHAVAANQEPIASLLVLKGADGTSYGTPEEAACRGFITLLKTLVEHANWKIDSSPVLVRTAGWMCKPDLNAFYGLMFYSPDPNVVAVSKNRDGRGWCVGCSAVHVIGLQDQLPVRQILFSLRLLIKRGANVNLRSASGKTPLMYYAEHRTEASLAAAKLLVELGADVNARDSSGLSAYDWANVYTFLGGCTSVDYPGASNWRAKNQDQYRIGKLFQTFLANAGAEVRQPFPSHIRPCNAN
jgi:hypothetical protein